MKTLNDYIKESLLDDEDVLIDKAKEVSKNWLLALKRAMLNDASEEELERIINQDMVKKEVSKLFYKFDGRMKWNCGKYNLTSNRGIYCILKDTKERSKYHSKSVLSFILWDNVDKNAVYIEIPDINKLSKTTSKNVKPIELEKFKKYLLDMGAEYSKTGSGKIQEDTLKI
jgi:hypothetical protein